MKMTYRGQNEGSFNITVCWPKSSLIFRLR